MLRLFILLSLIFSVVRLAYAEEKDQLIQIQSQLQSSLGSDYEFIQQRHIALLTKPVNSLGEVNFSSDYGLCWQIKKPYSSTLLVNEVGVHEIEDHKKAKLIMAGGNLVFEAFSKVYLALFNGELLNLREDFSVTTHPKDGGWVVLLVPTEKSPLSWLDRIEVSQTEGVNSLRLQEKNDDYSLISIKPIKLNEGVHKDIPCW